MFHMIDIRAVHAVGVAIGVSRGIQRPDPFAETAQGVSFLKIGMITQYDCLRLC
jgi:hypothetical protein